MGARRRESIEPSQLRVGGAHRGGSTEPRKGASASLPTATRSPQSPVTERVLPDGARAVRVVKLGVKHSAVVATPHQLAARLLEHVGQRRLGADLFKVDRVGLVALAVHRPAEQLARGRRLDGADVAVRGVRERESILVQQQLLGALAAARPAAVEDVGEAFDGARVVVVLADGVGHLCAFCVAARGRGPREDGRAGAGG